MSYTSVSWHADGGSSSDESDSVMMTTREQDSSTERLLIADAPTSVHRRSARPEIIQPRLTDKAKDERKYKYSLVSVLIIGICLIMMVNIGLGYRKCEPDQGEKMPKKPTVKSVCIDMKTGTIFPWQMYRLPTTLSPTSYHIFLHPNITLHSYTGRVTVNLTVNKDTNYVIMHSRGHDIASASLTMLSTSDQKAKNKHIFHCEDNDMVAFDFSQILEQGAEYQIVIEFSGNLTFSLGGFYLSKYKKNNGKEIVIGTTQFESTDARAAFPCFDEPAFKANFSLSLVRDPYFHTLFNMPLKSTNAYKGALKIDEFETSVKMSTYLVAFIVSDFASISNRTKTGVKVSIFSSPDKVNETQFALDIAVRILEYYEDLFKIPFPLPKMDLVAIPDFAAGAMENWGLVTYRETALLYNPVTSSVLDQEWVAKVIAHELSHQWFGNLVTMEWWNDLWLNEGFASFVENIGVDQVEPTWDYKHQIALEASSKAMKFDSSLYTHPISVPVTNTREIDQMFDEISYDKGACMISMLVDYLGNSFYEGVNAYLKKFAYGNAVNRDLIHAVSSAAGDQSIQKMMDTWTSMPGLPVVKLSLKKNQVEVVQSRFLYSDNDDGVDSANLWQIPLTFVTDQSPKTPTRHLLTWKQTSIKVPKFKWIKFNHNLTGYYRVSYDSTLWQRLSSQLNDNHEVFAVNDRISLVSDAFATARVGDISYSDVFKLVNYIKKEKEYSPIVTAISHLEYINDIFRVSLKESDHAIFESYVVDLLTPIYNELAWKDHETLTRTQAKLQSQVVKVVCSYNHKQCVKEAYKRFTAWKKNKTVLVPDEMTTVFKAAITNDNVEDWEYLWSVYANSTDATVNEKVLSAIAMTTRMKKIIFLQEEFLKGTIIRSQAAGRLVVSMTSNLVGGSLTWRFIKQHWDEIVKIHSVAGYTMRSIVKHCLGTILDEAEVAGAESFFVSKGISDMKYVKRSLESARINIYWAQKHLPTVAQWLNDNKATWSQSKP